MSKVIYLDPDLHDDEIQTLDEIDASTKESFEASFLAAWCKENNEHASSTTCRVLYWHDNGSLITMVFDMSDFVSSTLHGHILIDKDS